jgi:hypothetical protein
MELGEFKSNLLAAASLHENSWNSITKTYQVNIREACVREFDDPQWGQFAYLLLNLAWNDTLELANDYR